MAPSGLLGYLLVQGSSVLLKNLLAHDLIDEFRLLIYPLVLGKGKRLFGDGTLPCAFKVMTSSTSPSGPGRTRWAGGIFWIATKKVRP